jgi:hypothetical protein
MVQKVFGLASSAAKPAMAITARISVNMIGVTEVA